ncbi:MAG: DUF2142 domain-containing protein [Oscillospiraceae bacterium]|nr:DUF2142 domain-containing protein [Oscillospiraceae bacterium]
MTQKHHPAPAKKPRELLTALCVAGACFAVLLLVWLTVVRPNADKSLSERVCDEYSLYTLIEPGGCAEQTFTTSNDLIVMGFVFGVQGGQPTGELELALSDADTGEVLAHSTGDMAGILPGQYVALGLDHTVEGAENRHYRVTLTPHYAGEGRLSIGHSDGALLWNDQLTVNGENVAGTLALLITYRQIGGFLSRFFLVIGGLVCVVVFFGVWAALRRQLALHQLTFVLVLAFGMLYSFVLPPYAAPDEKYHINQSFTLACQWANRLSDDEWKMGHVPMDMTYRREHDANPLLQQERTTVFSWQELCGNLLTTTSDSFDSHAALEELQTDRNPTLYVISAAAVFVSYLLHLGFVPTLMLGRTANLLAFALLAAFAVKRAPFGKRVFFAVSLLPMTLHLAASFSRDSLLLGLSFAFTALCLQAIFGCRDGQVLPVSTWLPLVCFGILLAPAKLVYLPLAALFLLIPGNRLGRSANLKKAAYLAACVLLAVCINSSLLSNTVMASAPDTAVASAQAAPASVTDEPSRTVHAAPPSEQTQASETECWLDTIPQEYRENTASAFVHRLYYCSAGITDIPLRELEFWVDALQEGDVTAAVLGQSFFFSPEECENSALTDEEFMRAVSLVYLNRDLMQDAPEMCWDRLNNGDRRLFFKSIYACEEAAALLAPCQIIPGNEDDRYPLDRDVLIEEVQALQALKKAQSQPSEEDLVCYTPGYILRHLPQTILLVVRSVVEDAEGWVRGLVGGTLSYNSLNISWIWVMALYLLLFLAAVPARDVEAPGLPTGRYRIWCALAALACCALALAGCLVWTPTYYETIYGFQGRYLLPVVPLLLLTCLPRRLSVESGDDAAVSLACGLCLVNAGVLINAMLTVIAR